MRRSLLVLALCLPVVFHRGSEISARKSDFRLVEVTSVDKPTDITTRTNDQGLYIAEQSGRLVRFDRATRKTITALDLAGATKADGERGLLGVAFNPTGRFVYVNYTDTSGDTVVARYAMTNDNRADVTTRTVLFTLDQPYANHNGGGLAFGPGGRLYIGTGDGGSGGDPGRRALNRKTFLGKIVSIDPLAPNKSRAKPTIWSIGLRNPWRFEFDDSSNLWIADVGQNKWEEVDVAWAVDGSGRNANFGWSAYEGRVRYNEDQVVMKHHAPVYVYEHGDAGCSISGGTRVRSASLPSLRGWYVFGDYCSGRITALKVRGTTTEKSRTIVEKAGNVTAVRTVANGDVYVLALDGSVSILRDNTALG
jgi:glucose/arabinose dehydrogenase